MKKPLSFPDINALAQSLREELESKKYILIYAYNGTGKTRLSTAFKDIGKGDDTRDTLYFNAFTEDLFSWDNDLDSDRERVLKINSASHFFDGLAEMEMDTRVRALLSRYTDFDFRIDTDEWKVSFSRDVQVDGNHELADNIKICRSEEKIFIWCFFLAILQLALDDDGTGSYSWVKYIYIDDPISSLDEQNAIAVATHLAQLLKKSNGRLKTVISTHHTLFFNVLFNELKAANKYFLSKDREHDLFKLRDTCETPFFHHVVALTELYEAERSGKLFTHHFNMLRAIMEKTASFHGYKNFSACIRQADDDDGILHARIVNLLSHGNYSLFEPREMLEENKNYFRKILREFMERYPFNPELFPTDTTESESL